jgi:hypothetical protein
MATRLRGLKLIEKCIRDLHRRKKHFIRVNKARTAKGLPPDTLADQVYMKLLRIIEHCEDIAVERREWERMRSMSRDELFQHIYGGNGRGMGPFGNGATE